MGPEALEGIAVRLPSMSWITTCRRLVIAVAAAAAAAPARGEPADRPTLIVVVGAEGSAEYAPEFARSADRWADAARTASAHLIQIGRDANPASPDKERLKSTLAEESNEPPARPLWLILIGHGTYDRREAKFNLRGPDVSDQELAGWLAGCKRPLAVINCASASAPFLNRLSGANRIVITATQSGNEIQYTRFGDRMSAAVADPAADLDKDGQTSLLEAYLAASHNVQAFYKNEGRLATEHALLDDNGDALGTPADFFQGTRATRSAKDGAPLDGTRAHQWHLVKSAAERAIPAEVRANRDDLELRIEALRAKKQTLPESDYYAQLEGLLLQLARVYQPGPAPRPAEGNEVVPRP